MLKQLEKPKNYEDVTEKWLRKCEPTNSHVRELNYFKDKNGQRYYVDNKNVVLDYSKEAKECAIWLLKTFGGKIYMLPRINKPDGISTPDYLWNNEYWDLKTINVSGKRVIDNRLNGTKRQCSNYIIDITNKLLIKNALTQIHNVYYSKDRQWVDKLILKRNQELIKVFIRKKD